MDEFGLVMLRIGLAVGVTTGLVARLIQLAAERIRDRPFSRTVGWPAISVWTLGFAIATVAGAAAMSIGPLVLPFAVIVSGVAAWRCRALPEGAIGAGLGTGIVLFVVGLMNPTPLCRTDIARQGDARALAYCGVDGTSWLPLAVALAVAAVAVQILIERRRARQAHGLRRPITN